MYERPGFVIGEHKTEKWLDLGGHKGYFMRLAAERRVAAITSYEPNPVIYKDFLKPEFTKIENKRPGVAAAINKAVVADPAPKYVKLNMSPRDYLSSTVYEPDDSIIISSEVVGFAEAAEGHNCLKMDIEGAEADIIFNNSLEQFDKIVFEYHDFVPGLEGRIHEVVEQLYEYHGFVRYHGYMPEPRMPTFIVWAWK